MVDLVDAHETPGVALSPDRATLLVLQREGLPSIDELSQPELRLAGLRMNPRRYGPSRGSYSRQPSLITIETGAERPLTGLPEGARIGEASWSADSRYLAFSVAGDT
jgi:hypothetical protein